MAKKKALGRGLGDLLGDADEFYKEVSQSIKPFDLDINLIKPNPKQPRVNFDEESLKELADSIKEHGLLQPVLVYRDEDGYALIAGERRLRACKKLGLKSIKVIILEDVKEELLGELALIENIQRENLNPIELALSYKALLDEHNFTHEKLAQKIKKSRAQITNTLRILELDEKTKQLLMQGKLTQAHAKVIVGLDKEDEDFLVKKILSEDLNVKETEKIARELKSGEFWEQNSLDEDNIEIDKKKLSKSKLYSKNKLNEILNKADSASLEQLLVAFKSLSFKATLKKDSITINLSNPSDTQRLMKIIQANIK
ncbi:ParB/RepB/Spo0J family partition protein [Helicobacter sp. 11S02629-2]|uniref:ParB/RepB/Spo0J family partition protein n=1 Tax=Helicobacter sp. 11S02629-2 TaxID=1476195 RepID=UPI000BA66CE4|nr:ParB/RepB/Spo0J family partition protein [Helicobacter sp. 11S02629-2]PAF45911.1 hypothetical protein BKH40_00425 [Helicobacter sp. 11S02629-2]